MTTEIAEPPHRTARQPASDTMPKPSEFSSRAIIDIGSNSVRLVVYGGPARAPYIIHNEKVQARLGRGLAESGRIDDQAYERAVSGCRRFKVLLDAMGIADVRTVATAAARDAANGAGLLDDLRSIGLRPELLSGDEEAIGSAQGVLSAFPGATGLVGDLGGGSLELIELNAGKPGRRDTFPLGVLRLPQLRAGGEKAFKAGVAAMLREAGWRKAARGAPFYLVGGSWRALGHLDMHLTDSDLPGVHGYCFDRSRIAPMRGQIAELGPRLAKVVAGISSSRVAALDDAALLLDIVADQTGCERMVVSTFGLREGLLYAALTPKVRRMDPLLVAVADYAQRCGSPAWQGDQVAGWIAPLFRGETPDMERIRRAACHLAGVDLHPQSETRARHGMELAWLGGWIGLDAAERAMLAQALWTAWSGKGLCEPVAAFAAPDALRRAASWGEAIRLAERYSGGVSAVTSTAMLAADEGALVLSIARRHSALAGEIVTKQLGALGQALGLTPEIRTR